MKTKHTQGEWLLCKGVHKREDKLILSPDGRICEISLDREEAESNAKLIAAAPLLLKELIELRKWVVNLEDWKGIDPPIELESKAIKKATK